MSEEGPTKESDLKTESKIVIGGIISNSKGSKIGVMEKELGPVDTFDICLSNALRYLYRYKLKHHEEDINNAERYFTKAEKLCSKYAGNEIFKQKKIELDYSMTLYKKEKSNG